MEEFTLGSLFDGIAGFPESARCHGIPTKWASEIEAFPIKVSMKHFPDMEHLGDVTKINGAEIEPADIISFGSPCFVAGTLINTQRGMLPIEEVVVGDLVLTHTNRYRKVTKTMTNYCNDSLRRLNIVGRYDTFVTDEHPYYVREMKRYYGGKNANGKRNNMRTWKEPIWKKAKDLAVGVDYVGIAINQESENSKNLTLEECWLLGRYVADGYLRDSQRNGRPIGQTNAQVIFCLGSSKFVEFAQKVTDYHVCYSEGRTAIKAKICSKRLTSFARECGKGAVNKVVPQFVLNLPVEQLKTFMEGYMSGDGCFTNGCNQATTVSKKLVYQLAQVVAKVYQTTSNISFFQRPSTHIIEGRTVNQKSTWTISYHTEKKKQDHSVYIDGYLWSRVNENERIEYEGDVYNLEVDEDNSYTANNIIVHNCQDMSVAGKRAGLEGARSGLFMQAVRIIREMREISGGIYPRFAIWENVPGAFSGNNGQDFRAVLEEITETKIPMPKSGRWAEAGMVRGNGRDVAWRVLDAQYWGVPQRRKRIFLVADFAGECAGKILFERQGLLGDTAESGEAREEVAVSVGDGTKATSTTLSKKFKDMECEDLRPYCPTTPGDGVTKLLCEGCCCEEAYKNYLNEFTEASQDRQVFYESGPGWIGECKKSGCLRAEGENRPSRPTHTIVEPQLYDMTHAEEVIRAVEPDISPTLNARMGTGGNQVPVLMQLTYAFISGQSAQARSLGFAKEVSPVLKADAGGNTVPAICQPIAFNGRQDPVSGKVVGTLDTCSPQAQCIAYPDPANTLLAKANLSYRGDVDTVVTVDVRNLNETEELSGTLQSKNSGGYNLNYQNPVRIGYRVRRLTPVECLRLQGMPDDWLDIEGASDSAKYKAVGNGIAKPCPDFIFSQIVKVLRKEQAP